MEETKVLHKKKMIAPKLRFNGFDDSWSQKKLNTIAEINPSNKNLPEKFIYIDLESVFKGQLLKENEISKDGSPSRAQRYLQQNDILFQMVRPYQMNNLFFDKNGEYVASTGYAQIRTEENSKYIYQYLHLQTFVDKVIEKCTGTSYPSINSKDLGNILIGIPSLPEQQKIASFLSAVDDKIQLLNRKKQLLEQYKKGVMQQLFSGKLRFKDTNGKTYSNWEKKKLGDVTKYIKGFAFKSEDYKSSGIRIIRVSDLGADKIKADNEKIFISEDKINEYEKYQLKPGNIIITTVGSKPEMLESAVGRGIFVKTEGEGLLNQNLLKFENIDGVNNGFIMGLINSKKYHLHIKGIARGNANQANITVVDLLQFKIDLPSFEEQKKIADFLSAIDVKIESLSNQLSQTQNFKKGLLQQMFV